MSVFTDTICLGFSRAAQSAGRCDRKARIRATASTRAYRHSPWRTLRARVVRTDKERRSRPARPRRKIAFPGVSRLGNPSSISHLDDACDASMVPVLSSHIPDSRFPDPAVGMREGRFAGRGGLVVVLSRCSTRHGTILTRTSLKNLEKGRAARREIEIDLIRRRQDGGRNNVSEASRMSRRTQSGREKGRRGRQEEEEDGATWLRQSG